MNKQSSVLNYESATQTELNSELTKTGVLKHLLPYGGVMATGGASAIAAICGIKILVLPLLILAVLEGIWVPLAKIKKHRNQFGERIRYWLSIDPIDQQVGKHTVPLGLAVVLTGLIEQTSDFPWLKEIDFILFGLSWGIEIWMLIRIIKGFQLHRPRLWEIDGATFILPAGLLGIGIATLALSRISFPRFQSFLFILSLSTAFLGWGLFWLISIASFKRVLKYRLSGTISMFWWIWMGCAGLAAAALCKFLISGLSLSPVLHRVILWATASAALMALILCVPIFWGSLKFLLFQCRFKDKATWQPTFSTAVFTMGVYETGKVFDLHILVVLGLVTGFATLTFWGTTIIWNIIRRWI